MHSLPPRISFYGFEIKGAPRGALFYAHFQCVSNVFLCPQQLYAVIRFAFLFLKLFVTLSALSAQERATTASGKQVVLYADGTWKPLSAIPAGARLELPAVEAGNEVVHHTGFSLLYNETHEQAAWVGYVLRASQLGDGVERKDNFRVDPKIATGSATPNDYRRSGYDRGHLAPAADLAWSDAAMDDSFYMSNMSPQVPGHNRGVWKRLEEHVRDWARASDSLYVITGPILKPGLPTIGSNNVSVPEAYFKAIFHYQGEASKCIAFIVPNEASSEPLQHFAVNVDSVEQITGLDLFYAVEDELEEQIEATLCLPCWSW